MWNAYVKILILIFNLKSKFSFKSRLFFVILKALDLSKIIYFILFF